MEAREELVPDLSSEETVSTSTSLLDMMILSSPLVVKYNQFCELSVFKLVDGWFIVSTKQQAIANSDRKVKVWKRGGLRLLTTVYQIMRR